MPTSTTRRHLPGILLAVVFFGAGVWTIQDYGVTWDEEETYSAAEVNVQALGTLLHGGPFRQPWHELTGYSYVCDTLRGLFAQVVVQRWALTDVPTAFHFFHLILSALAVYLVFRLALRVSGNVRAACGSAAALACLPKFIAHAQNNPKDLPGLFVYVLTIDAFVRLALDGGWWRAVGAGLIFGLALSTHVVSVFVPVIVGLWLLADRRDLLVARWKESAVALAAGGVGLLLFWPWLWPAPWGRLMEAIHYVTAFRFDILVLYFGRIYRTVAVPWHYFLGSVLVSTPIVHVILAGLSLPVLLRGRPAKAASTASLARLGLIWCAVLAVVEMRSASRYDGVRHFLMFLPGLALLVGSGSEYGLSRLQSAVARAVLPRRASGVAYALLGLSVLPLGVSIARIHPYEDAYLNPVTNALLPGPAEEYFDLEYWGNTYKEGARWLSEHAEPHATLYAFWHANDRHYLKDRYRPFAPAFFDAAAGPQYVMLMTRSAAYDEFMRIVVRDYEPVFSIRRQKGTLLNIFKNTAKKP